MQIKGIGQQFRTMKKETFKQILKEYKLIVQKYDATDGSVMHAECIDWEVTFTLRELKEVLSNKMDVIFKPIDKGFKLVVVRKNTNAIKGLKDYLC